MTTELAPAPPNSKTMTWAGILIAVFPVLMLIISAGFKIAQADSVVEGFKQQGFPERFLVPIGVVELVCTILYIIPRTSVLGAILLTGYLGGATATHVRAAEIAFIGAVSFGVLLWLGLYLRDPRIRALLPLRR